MGGTDPTATPSDPGSRALGRASTSNLPGAPGAPEGPETVEAFDLAALNRGNRGLRLCDPALEAELEELLAGLTIEQKIAQMHGESVAPSDDLYTTPSLPALGLPGLKMVDGPRGVRAGTATTFPVALARGASFNPALEARVGQAIAREARARGANVLLAPAINLLRHPGWGRAQETYGEDSLHVGRMGAAFIAGAQRELVASVKHFALNSIEDTRFEVDVQVDEQTLREVYLPHFELCVRGAHVGSVMSAYNKVNGAYCAENQPLLAILKDEWKFLGFVESDWVFGTRSTLASLEAGLDIEMPEANYYGPRLLKAFHEGQLSEAQIDAAVRRILRVQLAFGLVQSASLALDATRSGSESEVIESIEHQDLALQVAQESMVLLKNSPGLLPLDRRLDVPLAVVGSLSRLENTGDHGSSAVSSSFVVSALEGISDRLPAAKLVSIARDQLSASDRARLANCRAAVVVVGLTWRDEGERIPLIEGGGDRSSLRLAAEAEQLVREVCALVPRTVVVLEAGSALEVRSFVDSVPGLLMAWYPGMLGGEALADVLFGKVCPSGKLPLSFPRQLDDLVPFDHHSKSVRYEHEHGYRHYERSGRTPEFPFGFGLSYTAFRYDAIALSAASLSEQGEVVVWVDVTNVGERAGAEVVQLYLSSADAPLARPPGPKQLVGFGRLELQAGQQKRLAMRVGARELAFWNVRARRFELASGSYLLHAGSSSRELPLVARLTVD